MEYVLFISFVMLLVLFVSNIKKINKISIFANIILLLGGGLACYGLVYSEELPKIYLAAFVFLCVLVFASADIYDILTEIIATDCVISISLLYAIREGYLIKEVFFMCPIIIAFSIVLLNGYPQHKPQKDR